MPGVFPARQRLLALLGGTLAVALGFVVAVLADLGPGVVLHEVAGLVLLLLVLACLDAAFRIRRADGRPLVRVLLALVALIWAGATGAGLALGALGPALTGLPLLPIALLLVLLADAIRVTREIGEQGAVGAVPIR